MSQPSETYIHDYARFYGLVRDHKICGPLECISPIEEHTYETALEDPRGGIEDPRDGYRHSPGSCPINTSGEDYTGDINPQCTTCVTEAPNASQMEIQNERMFIDAGTASVLASISQSAGASPFFDEDASRNTQRRQWLKHELPLLRSDPKCDLQEFIQPFAPGLKNEFLPFETLDEEADEGFKWPLKYLGLPDELWQNLLREKPKIPGEAMRYLLETTKYDARDIQGPSFEMEEEVGLISKKRTLPERSTPPLFPMSPKSLPFVPSSDAGHLDLLSDQSSPIKEALRKIELHIFAKHATKPKAKAAESSPQSSDPMILDPDSLGDIYSPLKGLQDSPSSPPDEILHPQKLKVEVPLSTTGDEVCPPWKGKSVSFNDALTEIIPNLPPPLPDFYRDTMLDEIDSFFGETIKPMAINFERSIEQEQLQEADTTRRVAVPIMDFTLPTAPWKVALVGPKNENIERRQDPSLIEIKSLQFKDHTWPLNGKIERELQWTPFPTALGKVELQETMLDDGSLIMFLTQPSCQDMYTLTWKSKGLRILDEIRTSDGEELDEGSLDDRQDFDSLVRKRRLDLQDDEEVSLVSNSRLAKANQAPRSLRGSTVSALDSLENFIHTRTGDVREMARSAINCTSIKAAIPGQIFNTNQHCSRNYGYDPWTLFQPALSSSSMVISRDCQLFIASATLLKDRRLAREIQKKYPAAELIERDFSICDCPEKNVSQRNLGPPKESLGTVEHEADIMLSPSTGLLWTTLQKVKQRSLPGHVVQSAIQERVRCVASRYERLIILVNEGRRSGEGHRSHPGSGIDSSDLEAIAHFAAFCSSLEDETQMMVSPGGIEELSIWIVALMVKHSVPYLGFALVQEETLWEVFLRRAGMNAFAAQVILGKLDEKNMKRRERSDFGLTAFVKMSEEERFARFEKVLGGRKLLSRISQTIESRW